jgi:hypothetical protein
MQDVGIIVFGHTRPLSLADVLTSLKMQGSIGLVEVWLDGHQGRPDIKEKTEHVFQVASNFSVKKIHRHNGMLGFRKMVLIALRDAVQKYKHLIILEDDCFPTRDAINIFQEELLLIENKNNVFSVYGHPFLMPSEGEFFTRFQGWGWATTSEKLSPFLDKLVDCYSLPEERFLEFVNRALTDEIVAKLDITPPRQPTHTLRKFFAWDETLALLTAMEGMTHKKTPKRAIYNFGADLDSSRFKDIDWYTKPPFNMVRQSDVWSYYEG